MQIPKSYRYKTAQNASRSHPSSRVITNKPLRSLEYKPYSYKDHSSDGLIGKVTSKITGMFKDIKSTMEHMFKADKEENSQCDSLNVTKESIGKDKDLLGIKNHPINQLNFSDLGKILSNTEPLKEKKEENRLQNIQAMEISFGGPPRKDDEISFQMTTSLRSEKTLDNGKENSLEVSALGLRDSGLIRSGKNKKVKVNVMGMLNICHKIFERKCKEYEKNPQSCHKTLRAYLRDGLPKPLADRSKKPTVTWKYNKVTDKYEPESIKKRKRIEYDEVESREDEFLHPALLQGKVSKGSSSAYKRNKIVEEESKTEPVKNVYINFKELLQKTPDVSPNKNKSNVISAGTFEMYETDETEGQDERKETPAKSVAYEEDKNDNISEVISSQDTCDSQSIGRGDNSFQPSERKPTPYRIKKEFSKMTSDLAQKILIGKGSTDKGKVKEESKNFSHKESLDLKSPSDQSTQVKIENPFTNLQNLDERNFEGSVSLDDKSQELPDTPTFSSNEAKESKAQDNNQEEQRPAENEEAKCDNIPVSEVQTGQEEKQIEPTSETEQGAINEKVELSKPIGEYTFGNEESKLKPALDVPDFLKAYQIEKQNTSENFENNPFLSKKSEIGFSFPFENQSKQEKSPNTGGSNPFLQPPTTLNNPMLNLASNVPLNNVGIDPTQSLKPVANLNIFNSQPTQTTINLFGPSPITTLTQNTIPATQPNTVRLSSFSSSSPVQGTVFTPQIQFGSDAMEEDSPGINTRPNMLSQSSTNILPSLQSPPNLFGLSPLGLQNHQNLSQTPQFGVLSINTDLLNNQPTPPLLVTSPPPGLGLLGNSFKSSPAPTGLLGLNQSSNNTQNINLFGNQNQQMTQGGFQVNMQNNDASRFLGLGINNNDNQQARVYRKIINHPFKGKTRAF